MYAAVTRKLICLHCVASKYDPCDIIVINWNNCNKVNDDFHQIGNDFPVSGTFVCIQTTCVLQKMKTKIC